MPRTLIPLFAALSALPVLFAASLAVAQDAAVERDTTKAQPDPAIAAQLDAHGTPYRVDEDGDYRIIVTISEERSQLVWVRSKIHTSGSHRVREIWTYGMRSDERRIPAHIANRLLMENFELVLGAWARDGGNAILVLKIDADADAQTLDEAIDLAATIGDRMEQRLVSGDEL